MSAITITVAGRLTADPELSANVQNCCNMRLAANGRFSRGETKTEFFNIAVFGKRAETCAAQLHKGDMVYVAGEFESNAYKTRNGEDRTELRITANTVEFLQKKGAGTSNNTSAQDDTSGEEDFL